MYRPVHTEWQQKRKLSVIVVVFYRPQTKFAKVMFLHLSVSHSVRGLVSALGGVCSWGVAASGGCMLLGDVSSQGVPASGVGGYLPPGGACSRGVSAPGVGGGLWRPLHRDGYCYGRFASYWNTFLFPLSFCFPLGFHFLYISPNTCKSCKCYPRTLFY